MKIKTFISVLAVALVLALPLISQTTSPGTFRAPTIKTGTTATSIYWTAGTIYNGGHAVSVAAGNAALGASQTSCAAPSFSACDFLYASSNGTVAVSTVLATATASGNTLLAMIETSAGSVPTSIALPMQSGTAWLQAAGPFTAGPFTATGGITPASSTVPYTFFSTFPPFVAPTSVTDVAREWYSQIFVPTNATLTGACFLTGSSPATDKAIVILWNASGAVVANSALTGSTIAGSSIFQCIAFTGTYAAVGPQTFYVGLQTNGTNATEISTYPAPSAPGTYGTGVQAAGVFGTLVNISSPSTTFNAGQGPVMALY